VPRLTPMVLFIVHGKALNRRSQRDHVKSVVGAANGDEPVLRDLLIASIGAIIHRTSVEVYLCDGPGEPP
jgi:hypothetical protein